MHFPRIRKAITLSTGLTLLLVSTVALAADQKAPDDKVAVVATPDAELGWIYARTTTLDAAVYDDAVRRLAAFGVDTGKLVRIPQLPPAQN